jgi:hypothetical protein
LETFLLTVLNILLLGVLVDRSLGEDLMAISLRGLLDRRIISILIRLHNHIVLVANPGSGIQTHVLLFVIGGFAWPTAVSLRGGLSLLEDFGPWYRVEELLEGFLGD